MSKDISSANIQSKTSSATTSHLVYNLKRRLANKNSISNQIRRSQNACRQNAVIQNAIDKVPLDKMQLDEMPSDKMPLDEML